MSTKQIRLMLTEQINPDDTVIADNAEPRLTAELQEIGHRVYPCIKGRDSILNGLTAMMDYNIVVDYESSNIKKELNNYRWHSKINKPMDDHNHAIDAARYAYDEMSRESKMIFV